MKINSKDLWEYINEQATDKKVKLNVYYDDQYITQIYWNGNSFEWEPGKFTSEAFFNPLYDFIVVEEQKKIPEKLNIEDDGNTITLFGEKENEWTILDNVDVSICNKINEIIDYLKSKGE